MRIIADLIFSYLKIGRGERQRDIAVLRLLFDLPQVFEIDYEILAAVVVSDITLLDEIPELGRPDTYGRFAAFLGELFPEARNEELSEEAVIRERDILEQLSRRRQPWNFDDSFET